MATQTRRIARYSTTFFRSTGKYVVLACSGLVLLSAIAAQASVVNGMPRNGMPRNGMPYNGMSYNGQGSNGMPRNGLPFQGCPMNGLLMNGTGAQDASYSSNPPSNVQNETLPWATLSQKALGKTSHKPRRSHAWGRRRSPDALAFLLPGTVSSGLFYFWLERA
jgi:hypothetical protein